MEQQIKLNLKTYKYLCTALFFNGPETETLVD